MNLRRFYLIITVMLSVFLFVSGTGILFYINSMGASEFNINNDDGENTVSGFLKSFVIDKDPVNVLLLVGDKAEANTDTMMVVNFNPETDKLSVLSLPRDTKVNVSGSIPKINSLYVRKNGEKLVIDTVSDLLGINIKYYVYLNISTFRKVIDLLGGVDYYVPVDMDYDDPIQNLHIHLKKGQQHLDGKKAEQFLRFRHPNGSYYSKEMMKYYDGSDIKRIEAQQNFVKEVIKQKVNIRYLPKITEIVNVVYENLETNITLNEILKLLKNIPDFSIENVSMFTLPGSAQQLGGIWYYICDKSETSSIMKEYFSAKGTFDESTIKDKNTKNTGASASTNAGKNTTQNSSSSQPPKETPKAPAEENIDVTKNNPSNADTSLQGTEQPIP
jgi:LCP family protein required for cell wall assembly